MLTRLSPLAAALLLALSTPAFAATPSTPNSATKTATPSQAAQAQNQAQKFDALAEEYYDRMARLDPLGATQTGDSRFNDQLTMTIAPAVRAKVFATYHEIAKRLHAIPRSALSEKEQLNYDCLDYELKTALAFEKYRDYLQPINHMDSVPVTLANFASGQSAQPMQTPADYAAYLHRIEQLPAWIDQAMSNMHEGVRQHIVLPKALIISALPQFKALVSADVDSNIFYSPVKHFPANFSDADKEKLTAGYRAAVTKLMPSLEKLSTYLSTDYLAAGRSSTGWSALPDGQQWYQTYIQSQTTTHLKPEEIHQLGLKEVARIQSEIAKLAPALNYTGDPKQLLAWLSTQDKYFPFTTEQQILDSYHELNRKIMAKLPELFGRMPKTPLDIRAEPEISRATASDHYSAPAVDGSRPGVFWAVINDPKKYQSTGMTTLFLHEGQPGHHFHLALMQEMDLPKFIKYGGNNAFVEGWALYAERLGTEMGLYQDPAAYAGHLSDEMLRAVRLVVDTGMHAKGWTREQSIAYIRDTLGYSEADAVNATERYMAWPAQALGYKIGQLKILELRTKAEKELGNKFDLRGFHDAILGDGTLPLDLLDKKMNKWIIEQKKAK